MPDKRKKVTFVKSKPAGPDGLRKVTKVKKMSEKRAKKKEAKGQGKMFKNYSTNVVRAAVSASDNSGINMGHSPAEMSPLDGHCGPMKMESSKQEKYNLMHDNPVAKHASGGSWMSKHSKSAFQMGHSPAEMGHESPAKHKGSAHGARHSEEVGHDGTNIHSHTSGKQKKKDDQMAAAEKRKKVKATIKAGKAIAKSM